MATKHYRKKGTNEVLPVDGEEVSVFEKEENQDNEWEAISPELYRQIRDNNGKDTNAG